MNAAFFFLGVMELLKLRFIASWAGFLPGVSLPILPAACAYFLAIVVGRLLRRRGARIIWHALAQLALAAVDFMVMKPHAAGGDSGGKVNVVVFYVALAAVILFQGRAIWLESRKVDHDFCARRFDEGLALFLGGLSVAAFVRVEIPGAKALIMPFFLFSMLSLGFARQTQAIRGGLSRRSGKSLAAWAALLFIPVAAGIVALMPALTEPARQAAALLGRGSLSLLDLLGRFLTWLFSLGKARPSRAVIESNEGTVLKMVEEESTSELGSLFSWVLLVIASFAAMLILGWLLYRLVKFLWKSSGTPAARRKRILLRDMVRTLLNRIAAILSAILGGAKKAALRIAGWFGIGRKPRSPVLDAWFRLADAGNITGQARRPTETPREFVLRLAARFPRTMARGEALLPLDSFLSRLESELYAPPAPDAVAGSSGMDDCNEAVRSLIKFHWTKKAFLSELLVRRPELPGSRRTGVSD
jgi:putative effector of murein hydrolase LrgA (UPF0299 family)